MGSATLIHRRAAAWSFLTVLTVAIAGCTSTEERSTNMPKDIDTATGAMREAVAATQRLLAPLQFTVDKTRSAASHGPCDLPSGEEGQSVLFPNLFSGPVSNPDSVLAMVAADWRAKGYTIRIANRGGGAIQQVIATTREGGALIFGVGRPGKPAAISAESACVPKRSNET